MSTVPNSTIIKGFGVANMCPFWPVVLRIVLLTQCLCVARMHAHIIVGLYMAPQERIQQIGYWVSWPKT